MTNANPPSLRRLAQAAVATLASHLELLGIELAEEKARWASIAILAAISIIFALLLLFAGCAWVLIYFWESHRLAAAGGLVVFFALALTLSMWRLKHHVSLSQQAFSATREELAKHRDLFP